MRSTEESKLAMRWPAEEILYQGRYHALINVLSLGLANIFSYFHVTNQRVVHKEGIFVRDIDEWVLNRITAVQVYQGFWGKLLGFGTIELYRSGQNSPDKLDYIADPQSFRDAVNWAKSSLEFPTAA